LYHCNGKVVVTIKVSQYSAMQLLSLLKATQVACGQDMAGCLYKLHATVTKNAG
jgi:hypothetical protein